MRLLLLFSLIPALLSAQSDFLKDPDIVWAAEIEQDWVVDVPSPEAEEDLGIHTLKLFSKELMRIYIVPPTLFKLVCFDAASDKLAIFKDAACKVPVKWNEIFPNLPQYCFDPENYDEFGGVYCRESHIIKTWRLRQVLAYHKKSATWSTFVESIAPLMEVKNEQGDSVGTTPMFWFRPDNKRQKLNSKDVVWAKKMTNKQAKSQVPTNPGNMVKVIDGFQNPLTHLLEVLKTDSKTTFYNAWNEAPLSMEERVTATTPFQGMLVVFDPETYEEKVVKVRDELDASSFRQFQLVQTWYWDARHSRLSICLDAVAPLTERRFRSETQKIARVLFYRRAKK